MRLAAVAATGLVLTLGACATITEAPAGDVRAKSGSYSYTLGRSWSDISILYPLRNKKVSVLTTDGPALNQLFFADGLAAGEGILRSPRKETPAPTYRAGMSVSERMEFIADSVTLQDYKRVETSRPRPAKFGAHDGVRFDLSAQTPAGLDISGTALAAEIDGKFYAMLYVAPAEHYFAAGLPEVERIMGSVRQ